MLSVSRGNEGFPRYRHPVVPVSRGIRVPWYRYPVVTRRYPDVSASRGTGVPWYPCLVVSVSRGIGIPWHRYPVRRNLDTERPVHPLQTPLYTWDVSYFYDRLFITVSARCWSRLCTFVLRMVWARFWVFVVLLRTPVLLLWHAVL